MKTPRIGTSVVAMTVLLFAAQALGGEPGGEPKVGAGISMPSEEVLQRLKRFGQIANTNQVDVTDSGRTSAQSLEQALQAECEAHPENVPYLRYYMAKVKEILKHYDEMAKWAPPVAQDLTNPNCADARRILGRHLYLSTGEKIEKETEEFRERLDRSKIEVFPCGFYADLAVDREKPSMFDHNDPSSHLIRNWGNTNAAAEMYRGMNLLSEAISTYGLTIGFLNINTFSDQVAPVWMAIGDCYSAQGERSKALDNFYKSLASGQPLADVTPRIQREVQAINEKRPAAALEVKPDAKTLEKIAESLGRTDLYDQAISAAEAAEKIAGKPSALLPGLHQRKADMMQLMLKMTKEGVVVRGITVTKESIAKELELAKRP
jgi:tetratricopeptide (TPR) repeat protein